MPDLPLQPDPKPRPIDYGTTPSWSSRLARHLPSADQVAGFLKTLVWVAPLTLLIWVYAEREQSVVQPGVTVPIEVWTSDANRLVTLRRPADKLIIVELSGPRERMDRVQDALKTANGTQVQIPIDPKIGLGGQELLTVSAINNDPLFKNLGITVKSAQPPYLYVDIDTYEEREVPVRPPPDVAKLLGDATLITPSQVRLRAPSQLFKTVPAEQLVVYADLANRPELKNNKSGQPIKLDSVPLNWVHKEHVTITPPTVSASLEVKANDEPYEHPSVPVSIEAPIGLLDRVKVEVVGTAVQPITVTNVKMAGPKAQIELIKSDPSKVRARLPISNQDPLDTTITRTLQIDLPPGVALTPEGTKRMQWDFRLVPR